MTIWFPDNYLSNSCRLDYLTKISFSQEMWDEFLAEFDNPHEVYSGPVWYVSTAGDDSLGDGSSIWPFKTIQKGINTASSGDTVAVASGHYYERIDFLGKGILVTGNGEFGEKATRSDSTIIDADTSVLGSSDTGSVVVFVSGENFNSILEGFVLQNGIGTSDGSDNRFGGGVYCFNSSPTLRNNVIRENQATFGGGIDFYQSLSPMVINNRIVDNTASSGGGGISCRESSSPVMSYNIITGNSAPSGGGILCDMNCMANIFNNVIDGNSASSAGGGIMCDWNASPTITNNIICNSPDGEGIYSLDEAWPTISFNDVWNNADGDFYGGQPGLGDITWGTNFIHIPCDSFFNITANPMWGGVENYTLLCISPCIDAGNSSFEVPDSGGRRIDIGIYEYPYVIGDGNQNGEINISDVVYLANCIFSSGYCPCPFGAGDANCDGNVGVSDIVYLVNYLFRGGSEPGCN
jgi:parallel beta-helix repeat protein